MKTPEDVRVFRSFALPLVTFDYLKSFQRDYEAQHRISITNNQALTLIFEQHKQLTNVESELHGTSDSTSRNPRVSR